MGKAEGRDEKGADRGPPPLGYRVRWRRFQSSASRRASVRSSRSHGTLALPK